MGKCSPLHFHFIHLWSKTIPPADLSTWLDSMDTSLSTVFTLPQAGAYRATSLPSLLVHPPFFFSSQKTHTLPNHSFGHPTWSRLIIGHRPVHSDWSSNATGPKLRQSETRSSGTTGEDSLLLNLVKGVSPKQPATLSHIMGRNLRKSEEEQAMLQARGQVPKQPRCPDAVSCRPTHQSSKPLSNLNWPSTARY